MSHLGPGPNYKMTLAMADRIMVDFNNMGSDYVHEHHADYGMSAMRIELFLARNWFMKYKPRSAFLEGI